MWPDCGSREHAWYVLDSAVDRLWVAVEGGGPVEGTKISAPLVTSVRPRGGDLAGGRRRFSLMWDAPQWPTVVTSTRSDPRAEHKPTLCETRGEPESVGRSNA